MKKKLKIKKNQQNKRINKKINKKKIKIKRIKRNDFQNDIY